MAIALGAPNSSARKELWDYVVYPISYVSRALVMGAGYPAGGKDAFLAASTSSARSTWDATRRSARDLSRYYDLSFNYDTSMDTVKKAKGVAKKIKDKFKADTTTAPASQPSTGSGLSGDTVYTPFLPGAEELLPQVPSTSNTPGLMSVDGGLPPATDVSGMSTQIKPLAVLGMIGAGIAALGLAYFGVRALRGGSASSELPRQGGGGRIPPTDDVIDLNERDGVWAAR